MKLITSLLFLFALTNAYGEQAYWIDVRSGFEFGMGHLEGAINIPHSDIANEISQVTQDKNAKIHLYCRSGNRSGKALRVLQELGYENAVNEGGYSEIMQRREAQ